MKNNLSKYDINHSFSIFYNNIRSLNRNLENLQSHLLEEFDFHFDVIGVTETKIANSNLEEFIPSIPGYNCAYVPTPLSAGGVEMFIDASLDYVILAKTSTMAYQALWIEISFTDKRHIVCGIITDTVEKFISSDKTLCLMGDVNINLLKSTHCQFAHDFLSTILSCYLIPTIDKPTRVHRSLATLIDNIRLCHTAAILSRETKKVLFYHPEPRSQNRGGEAKRGKTKLFWSLGTIWPPCDKGEYSLVIQSKSH